MKTKPYGRLITMSGDATKPELRSVDEVAVIPHVCNDLGGWGKGFVLALNKAFGFLPKNTYLLDVTSYGSESNPENSLGSVSYANMIDKRKIVVANMIAQHAYIDALHNPRPLRYDALFECMINVAQHVIGMRKIDNINASIHCPKFGSDLAGGNWDFIEKMIEDCWCRRGIDVTVYVWAG